MKIKMTKLFFASLLTIASFNIANAQYEKGDKLLNIGIGNSYGYGGGVPLGVSLEVGITDDISVGGIVDYISNKDGFGKFTSSFIGGRGSYHLNKILNFNEEKIDLYAGLGLGFYSFKYKNDGVPGGFGSNTSGLDFNGFAGARYYFKPSLGGFLEVGQVGLSRVKLGLALKF